MRKAVSILSRLAIVMAFAIPLYAQWDTGTDPKMGVENVQYLSGGCTSDMTADQCMASGFAGGIKSCTASACAQCGKSFFTGKVDCYTTKGLNGWCECSVETTYDAANNRYVTTCTATGQCTYAP